MKLLALIEGSEHVCYRYRLAAYAPALSAHGCTLWAEPIARHALARVGQLHRAARADIVILQRKLLPFWQLQLLRRRAKVLVYDLDDALYCRDSFHRRGSSSRGRLARFWATVYAADAVIVGNRHLRDETVNYVAADKVFLVPTCVEPAHYTPASHRRRGGDVKLVWIGQRTTLPGLQQLEPHLAAAAAELPGLELRVISDRFPRMSGIGVVTCPWSQATETDDLGDADIGVSWLPDDAWSRGKCGLKVLQYMAAGLPVLANPVGMHRQMVVDGENGFLVETPAEWAAAARRLAADPGLRARLGAAGRRRVEERYSVVRWENELAALIQRLARHEVPAYDEA